ncbi:hypothetical protein B0H13DRAFT_1909300 [Mycena leptocephala]|nr:hypothetical protein B0H13DRAFT_1909300 [Mycena leptocephala]
MPTHLSAATIHELGTKLGEDFGFADDQSFRVLSAKQNLQAQRATSIQMLKYFRGDEGVDEPRSAVLENFAARFLPSLISAYRSQPDNSTLACYNFAIASLVGSPYFHKYIRRTANGYRLLAWTTDVAVQEQLSTPHKNSYSPNDHSLEIERSYCSHGTWDGQQIEDMLRSLSKRRLRKLDLKVLRSIYQYALECADYLNPLKVVTICPWVVPWVECGAFVEHCRCAQKPCIAFCPPPMTKQQRKQCSGCQATTYCSKEHQTLDWPDSHSNKSYTRFLISIYYGPLPGKLKSKKSYLVIAYKSEWQGGFVPKQKEVVNLTNHLLRVAQGLKGMFTRAFRIVHQMDSSMQ